MFMNHSGIKLKQENRRITLKKPLMPFIRKSDIRALRQKNVQRSYQWSKVRCKRLRAKQLIMSLKNLKGKKRPNRQEGEFAIIRQIHFCEFLNPPIPLFSSRVVNHRNRRGSQEPTLNTTLYWVLKFWKNI